MSTEAPRFSGPVFVVGMPRSGTRLVRALLNSHPRISLSLAESHFVPFVVRRYGRGASLQTPAEVARVLDYVSATPFGVQLRRRGVFLDRERARALAPATWASLTEALLRAAGPKPGPEFLWGDKTPGYVLHMPLLRELFPTARFLHVMRDPRDQVFSVQRSFGKDPLRAAQRWRTTVAQADAAGAALGKSYCTVDYEELTESPESALRQICEFLDLPFDRQMLALDSSQEDLGDARGVRGVLSGNTGKWRDAWSHKTRMRIEGIVGQVARAHGYALDERSADRPLGRVELAWRFLLDALPTLRHHLRAEGSVRGGVRRAIVHYRGSSWRGAHGTESDRA